MSFTALKKLDRQTRQFVDNTVFDKVDSDKTKKNARNSMKKIILSLTLRLGELSEILKIEKLIKSTIKEMNYLNDNYLQEKRIETLINRFEDHCYAFLDDFKNTIYDSDLDLSLSESSDERSDDEDCSSSCSSGSDSESDSDENTNNTSESESESDFDIKEDFNKLTDLGYFTCTDSECSCNSVFECECSESECSCDEDDNMISRKKIKQLRKYNRKFSKRSDKQTEIDIDLD